MVAFAEKVWFKEIRDTKERKNKLSTEWKEGIWLGHSRASNETILGTDTGIVRAYAVKRQDEVERWAGDLIKRIPRRNRTQANQVS